MEVNKVLGGMGEPVTVESAAVIKQPNEKQGALVLVRFKSWNDKLTAFKQKHTLTVGGSKVFIDDDLTKREHEIRFYQRQLRKEEKMKNPGTEIKCRGDRVCLNGEWKVFNEQTKSFVNEKN